MSEKPKHPDTLISDLDRAIERMKFNISLYHQYDKDNEVLRTLILARERIQKISTFDNETVKKAREVLEREIDGCNEAHVAGVYATDDDYILDLQNHALVLDALDTMEREVERLKEINKDWDDRFEHADRGIGYLFDLMNGSREIDDTELNDFYKESYEKYFKEPVDER